MREGKKEKGQITTSTPPAEIEKYADHLVEVMTQANIPNDRTTLVQQLKERAASHHGIDVPTWEQRFAPAPAAPKVPKKKAPPVTREAVAQRIKGASTKVDPDYFWISEQNQA